MEIDIIEITKKRIFKVWWCLLWRAYLGGAMVGLVVWGVTIAFKYCVFRLLGKPSIGELSNETIQLIQLIEQLGSFLGLALLIYISFVVVRFIFKKKFSDFEIVLIARDQQKPKDEQ